MIVYVSKSVVFLDLSPFGEANYARLQAHDIVDSSINGLDYSVITFSTWYRGRSSPLLLYLSVIMQNVLRGVSRESVAFFLTRERARQSSYHRRIQMITRNKNDHERTSDDSDDV